MDTKKVLKENLMVLIVQHILVTMLGEIVTYQCSDFQKIRKDAENGYKTQEGMT